MNLDRAAVLMPAAAVIALAAVAAALASQHIGGMLPCAWCVLQRLIFLKLAGAAVLGTVWATPLGRRVGAGLALAFALAGMAAALWQHFVAANSQSCVQTLADRIVGFFGLDSLLPEVFAAYASCAESKVNLFGLPYEFYSLALFALLALISLRVLRRAS